MTRGRHPSPTPEAIPDTLDREATLAKSEALTVLGTRSAEVAERFGDGQPYDRARVVSEARFFMAQSAEAMLELGKRLIQIKENEPRGEFIQIVTERLGITDRTARLFMNAAVKFVASDSNRKTFSVLGRSKLFELLGEPDEELEALAEGGTVAGLTLDAMQTMSCRELRAALLEARKTLTAKDAVIAKKDAKLNKLAEEAELRGAIGSDEAATLQGLRDATASAEIAVAQLGATVASALESMSSEACLTAGRQAVEYIAQRLADLIHAQGIAVDFESMVQVYDLGSGEATTPATPKRQKKV